MNKKEITLVAKIENEVLTLEIPYPKGTDPEIARAAAEELIYVFEKYYELLED